MIKMFNICTLIILLIIICMSCVHGSSNEDWTDDFRLSNSNKSSENPSIDVSGKQIHLVWGGEEEDGNFEIFYRRSIDNGVSWNEILRLTDSDISQNPVIAVDGSNIHIVWQDQRDGNSEIYYKRSTNYGENWGNDIRLTADNSSSYSPDISVESEIIHISWIDMRDDARDIYYKRSSNSGESWENDMRLTNLDDNPNHPKIVCNGSNVHIAFDVQDDTYDIYWMGSSDGGITWTDPMNIINQEGGSQDVDIAIWGNTLHAVWKDKRDGDFEIFYIRGENNGQAWSAQKKLTSTSKHSESPSIGVNREKIHIVWQDSREDGNPEVYYKRSLDNGKNWETDMRLTNADEPSARPEIGVIGNNINIVWQDHRNGKYEIFKKSKLNRPPTLESFDLSNRTIFLGNSAVILANGSDDNDDENNLTLILQHFDASETTWKSDYVSSPSWNGIHWFWEISFSPAMNAVTGEYVLRLAFFDSDGDHSEWQSFKIEADF